MVFVFNMIVCSSTDVNECGSSPCQNGATCNDQVNKYRCTCVAGYAGTNCQTSKLTIDIIYLRQQCCGITHICWQGKYFSLIKSNLPNRRRTENITTESRSMITEQLAIANKGISIHNRSSQKQNRESCKR